MREMINSKKIFFDLFDRKQIKQMRDAGAKEAERNKTRISYLC
jgi:hypothetical protein